jgi:hypothetical protein
MKDSMAVSILGMHRSGTSCLTGCLQECGLNLGDVVTHTFDNLKGNRESLKIRAVNNAVLAFNRGSWKSPPEKVTWDDELRRARDEIIASYAPMRTWGFKDPRTLLTLPFWLEALPALRLIGTFRHPLAVADSLFRRDGIPINRVLELWTIYNERLYHYVSEFDVALVCFDWTANLYAAAIRHIANDLGLEYSHGRNPPQFFDEGLKSHHDTSSLHGAAIEAEELYQNLLSRSLDVAVEN